MIRRLQHDAIREAMTRRVVAGGNHSAPAIEVPVLAQPDDNDAYRSGYAEGYEAGESDGLRDARQRTHELEETARMGLQELTDERERLAELVDGLGKAVHCHHEAMEAVAFEVALISLARAFGQMQEDRQLLQRLCNQVAGEFRDKAVRLAVSTQDRPILPDQVNDLEVVVERGLKRGECRVVTDCGQVESSIRMRLDAIHGAMLQSLGMECP